MVPAVGALWCQECLVLADREARGWRLARVDVPGEDEEPLLTAYCPECAEREFGLSPVSTRDAPNRFSRDSYVRLPGGYAGQREPGHGG
jgi:hypothetical protein